MQMALRQNTAQLDPKGGDVQAFPVNTDDAIFNGCLNAALGTIQTQWQHLEDLVKMPPKLLLSGGDAAVLAKNLPEYLVKHHNIVDNLVLVGLMRLGREKA
jgi:type III pantothenate kinase